MTSCTARSDNDYGITMIGTCTQAGVPIKLHCHMIPTTTRTVTINSELYKQAAIFIVELKKTDTNMTATVDHWYVLIYKQLNG